MMFAKDFVAAFDLALESEGYNPPWPVVKVKDTRKGTARYKTHSCTLPRWVLSQPEAYVISYAVHEAAHFVVHQRYGNRVECHGTIFKAVEKEMLAVWGFVPVYSKAYVRELKNAAGRSLWKDTAIGKNGGKRRKKRMRIAIRAGVVVRHAHDVMLTGDKFDA